MKLRQTGHLTGLLTAAIFVFMLLPPPISTLFPYTTLFRSTPATNKLGQPNKKVLVFTAFADTAEYVFDALSSWARKEMRSEEHTSELQSHSDIVCRLLLEKKKQHSNPHNDQQVLFEQTPYR